MKKKKVIVIGAGFSGLSTATELADKGYEVMIVEKNEQAGGRARVFKEALIIITVGDGVYKAP